MNTSASGWTDEQLMAWSDGALAADEVAALEAAIETDADLANRAAAMQQTRALVQEAYEVRGATEAVPAALQAAVEGMVARDRQRRASRAGASPAAGTEASRPGWRERLRQWFGGFGMPTALAASLACGVIGFLIGQAGQPPDHGGDLVRVEQVGSARETAAHDAGSPAAAPLPGRVAEPGGGAPASVPGPGSRPAPSLAAAPEPEHSVTAMASEAPRNRAARTAPATGDSAGAPGPSGSRGSPSPPGPPGSVPPTRQAVVGEPVPAELARLLDQLPGGGEGRLGPAPVAVVATYRDREGRVCRDFSIAVADQTRLESVACRGDDAAWQVSYAALTRDDGSGFAPASSNSALEAYLGSIGADQPLDPEAERAALARPGARQEAAPRE